MVIKSLNVAQFKEFQPVVIGRQLENNYRQFIFNCSGFGNVASVMLVHQRSSDVAPYIVGSVSGDVLTWTVADTDTSYAGSGQAELRIVFADGLAKSVIFRTVVLKSITADTVIPSALQSWYDAMIDYIDDHSISPDELGQAIEDYIEQHPISAPVTSVNSMIGDVVLTAADVGALPDSVTIPTKTSQLQNDSGFLSSAVTSFNGQTGAVTYTAPVSSVDGKTGTVTILPTGGTTGQVLAKKTGTNYDVEWQTVSGGGAVDSVNGQTGTVVLDADDVGALPDDTAYVASFNGSTGAVTYVAPVTSVNAKTGAVTVAEIFWCVYGTTTSAEIEAAIAAGQLPCVQYNDYTYVLAFRNSATNHRFVCFYGGKEKSIACQSGTWIPNGDLTFLTTSYTPPVTSVNGQTGAVVIQTGGLTQAQINALDGMFRAAAYAEDATAEYAAFCTAFGIVTTYSITNTLTNVTNSNAATSISGGSSYTGTLTADSGYNIDTVTVTMGGVDITATAYSGGTVSIASVTGNIVITASASTSSGKSDMDEWTDGVAYTDLTVVANEYVKSNSGAFAAYNGWSRTGFVYCEGASTITFPAMPDDGSGGSDLGTSNAWYTDQNTNTRISNISISKTHSTTVTVPANAKYFAISSATAGLESCIANGIVPNA